MWLERGELSLRQLAEKNDAGQRVGNRIIGMSVHQDAPSSQRVFATSILVELKLDSTRLTPGCAAKCFLLVPHF